MLRGFGSSRLLSAALVVMTAGCSSGSSASRATPATSADAMGALDSPALPGLTGTPSLTEKLKAALTAKGTDYQARTHHKHDDGSPKFVNRLIFETSPYLLQHAHNPVNWWPWSDEAFERARQEKKPVLLSIGYSTCHWCHVMERESFEDLEIAQYLNENFICIKVDREERPDVDDIYMRAVQALTGRGGWPMNTVLTPDREPFFGGTYFPPRDGARGSRKGFLTIMKELRAKYDADPKAVIEEAKSLSERIAKASRPAPPGGLPGAKAIDGAARNSARSFDGTQGGFGRAPKFPTPVRLEMLLRYYRRTGDVQARDMVAFTLEKMAGGGMYDHAGGGFHRYSTDARWLVPHFEKMLYDNGQLAVVYLEGYQATGRKGFARVAREILDYVTREMTAPSGGYYSATDADSIGPKGHDEEGYYFTWTPTEVAAVVGADRARLVNAAYNVTPRGNFEGRSILNTPIAFEDVASTLEITPEELRSETRAALDLLYTARQKRTPPIKDDKILTSWNGLMISGFADGAFVLGEAKYAESARRSARFILDHMRGSDGRLKRSFNNGQAKHTAYLDDYAFFIQGLLDLFDATSEVQWLSEAVALQKLLDAHYLDAKGGGYFMTANDAEKLLARDKPAYDGAEPSGNAVAILNLLRLSELTQDPSYRKRAELCLRAFSASLRRSGGMSKMLTALDFYLDKPREVLIVSPTEGGETEPLLAKVRAAYLPNRIVVVTTEGEALKKHTAAISLLEGKAALKGKTTAFVCTFGNCELPTSDPEVLEKQLAKYEPLMDGEQEPLPVR